MINFGTLLISIPLATGVNADVLDTEALTAREIIIEDVREDSMTRTSLNSEENNPVTVDVSGFVQFRYVYSDDGSDTSSRGFDMNRARVKFSGKVYDFDYAVSGQWSDADFELKDAFLSGNFGGFGVQAGQFVTSFYNGYVSDPSTLVTGEYTITALTYGQGRSQGFEVSRSFGDFSAYVSYNDGFNSDNTNYGDNDYGISGRLEYSGLDNFTVGGAFANQQTTTESYDSFTVDAGYDFGDFDVNAAFVAANWNDSWQNYSIVGTASYSFSDEIQAFGQYEYGVLDGSVSDLSVGTVGVNYHFNSHVRWTNSFGYSFDGIDGGYNLDDTGWQTSATDGQYLVKSMIQITF